jgi:hypothetical protein
MISYRFGIFIKSVKEKHGVLFIINFTNTFQCVWETNRQDCNLITFAFWQALVASIIVEYE